MLPGFRILLAFTMLSVSVVIFALGAAAFLRSAHEDVANAPWRPIETPVTARVDLAPATLAMLRVEPETPPTLPATNAEPAATIAPPAEIKPQVTKVDAADVAALPAPRIEQATPPAARIAEEPAKPAQAEPPLAPQPAVAASDALRDAAPPAPIEAKPAETRPTDATVTETKAAETTIAETKAADDKVSAPADAQPAPTVVAALSPDKAEPQPKSSAERAPVPTAASPDTLAPATAAAPAEPTVAGADTLKADDKAIKSAAPLIVAVLGEPAAQPLPAKEVKIPPPRVDPAVLEARRKQKLLQQRARARAAKARRIAVARARAAAQAKAAAATSSPFGAPTNTTTTSSTRAN